MTTNLRDRMAYELDHLGVVDDLASTTIRQGHRVARRRRAAIGGLAVMALTVGVAGNSLIRPDTNTTVADQPNGSTNASRAANAKNARSTWEDALHDAFSADLPAGFEGLTKQGGGSSVQALQFITTGPRGQVQLNANVYHDASIPTPSCETTQAEDCQVVGIENGASTVLRNRYPEQENQPQASGIWIFLDDGTKAIVNVVETQPGDSQFTMSDLVRLGTSEKLLQAINFAASNEQLVAGPPAPSSRAKN